MCGIVGYAGRQPAAEILLDALKRLEYRGYDSAGTAVVNGHNSLQLTKTAGRLEKLKTLVERRRPQGALGIGHTRWATHGRPSDENAHPHVDCGGRIAVVHNGIVENYADLRRRLEQEGHRFRSETDTEVIPHLIEAFYQGDLVQAVREAVALLRGSYALAVISLDEPDKLVAVRHHSPLVIGLGRGENFLASDIPAILPYTRQVLILEDGEMAVVTAGSVSVSNGDGRPVQKRPQHIRWDVGAAEKNGHEHFMHKEIHEQPGAIRDTLMAYLEPAAPAVHFPEVALTPRQARELQRVVILGMGTARHAGLVGKEALQRLAGIPVDVELASEFRYSRPLLSPKTLAIAISQSGETADTLAGMREARRLGARVLAITNVVGSSVAREADDVIYTQAGPEVAVASTKAYLAQLVALFALALHLGQMRGVVSPIRFAALRDDLHRLPRAVEEVLGREAEVVEVAREMEPARHAFFIGRGLDYASVVEGALKLKEISYIHAEAYPAGELKHGTLALIEEGVPVVASLTQPHLFEKMVSNVKEVAARGGIVWGLVGAGLPADASQAHRVFVLPPTPDLLAPVVSVVPMQLLAYHVARLRGCDIDKPRNLAKSVTVE